MIHVPAHDSQYHNWRSLCFRKILKDPENMFFTIYFKIEPLRRDPVTIFSYTIDSFMCLLITGPILHAGIQLWVCAEGPADCAIILGVICMYCMCHARLLVFLGMGEGPPQSTQIPRWDSASLLCKKMYVPCCANPGMVVSTLPCPGPQLVYPPSHKGWS